MPSVTAAGEFAETGRPPTAKRVRAPGHHRAEAAFVGQAFRGASVAPEAVRARAESYARLSRVVVSHRIRVTLCAAPPDRGSAPARAPPIGNDALVKRRTAVIGLAMAGAALCAGCGSSGTGVATVVNAPSTVTATTTVVKTVRSTAQETVTTTVTAGADGYPPADFHDHGNGVYSAFETDKDSFNCADTDNRCWAVKVTAPAGCPNGVALKLTIYPVGSNDAAATVDQTEPAALAPQEIKTIVVGSNKLPGDQRFEAEITEARCG